MREANPFKFKRTWGPTPHYEMVEEYQSKSDEFVVIAGPCSVESREQIFRIAEHVASQGATHLRGGVYRAGTYPGKSNFGLVDDHLLLAFQEAAQAFKLKNIIEVIDLRLASKCFAYADCLQVGCRQMQNYPLLRVLGVLGKPVFLKRHPGATIDEWLGAAEHILRSAYANDEQTEVHLIERGSSTQATHVRWDLSISMIPAVKAITKMPILVDASHGTGRRDLVEPMTLAGVAAGSSGMLVEVHDEPEKSLSDADQAIDFEAFNKLMNKVKGVRNALHSV